MVLIGDKRELVLVLRRPRGRIYHVCCFGTKRHYRADGACKHTDAVLANAKPGAKLRVDPWGGKPPT